MIWKQCSTIGARRPAKVRARFLRKRADSSAMSGFSLMEVVVSVSLFVVIILSSTEIFKLVIDSQRSALAAQNVQESLKYFLEVIGKEIRMAQVNKGVCPLIPPSKVFLVTSGTLGDTLSFKNYYNQCVTYSLVADGSNQRFQIARNTAVDFISPLKVQIDNLNFTLNGGVGSQSMVTVNLRAHALDEAKSKSDMVIQTSLTSRYYKE